MYSYIHGLQFIHTRAIADFRFLHSVGREIAFRSLDLLVVCEISLRLVDGDKRIFLALKRIYLIHLDVQTTNTL